MSRSQTDLGQRLVPAAALERGHAGPVGACRDVQNAQQPSGARHHTLGSSRHGRRQVEVADVDDLFYTPKHAYTAGLLASLPRLDSAPPATPPSQIIP